MAEQVFHISDPDLFTYICETPLVDAKIVDQMRREHTLNVKMKIFKRPIYIQVSKFPGLKTLNGITSEKHLETVKYISVRPTQSIIDFDSMLHNFLKEKVDADVNYRSIVSEYRERQSLFNIRLKKSTFYTFGEGENMVVIDNPEKFVKKNSSVIPVIRLNGMCEHLGIWKPSIDLKHCFVIPPEPEKCLVDFKEDGRSEVHLEAPRNDEICVMCLDQNVEIVFLPCGHFCSCSSCSQRCRTCPICRSALSRMVNWRNVTGDMRIFRV